MFSDALLFDMMLNTAFEDGIDTIQDLIDRDMYLGLYERIILSKFQKFYL